MTAPLQRIQVGTVGFDPITESDVVSRVCHDLGEGRGGWISTPNVDILRRSAHDSAVRQLISVADLVVADGAPVVWAARLRGRPLPERVAGSSLMWTLSAAAAQSERGIFLLGGGPGVAEQAARRLTEHAPGLRVTGTAAPPRGFEQDEQEMARLRAALRAAQPDIVFVGLGCPKQERLIQELAPDLPATWWIGCGAALDFAAGELRRAPGWMQDSGLEWLYRLVSEPRRLARRYLVDDLPYALRLLVGSALSGRTAAAAPPPRVITPV